MAKSSLPPGFRFHPTDVELVWYYLKRKVMDKPFRFEAISVVDLYKFPPWDLPGKSSLRNRDLEWYFFCPRDRKYSHGSRTNRATEIGFWKTTGKDRSIVHNSQTVGMKKTLIFHLGKPPHGSRTDWVMYEFRLQSESLVNAGYAQDKYVLCKIFQKTGLGPKNGEQYGAPFMEEDWDDDGDIEHGGFFPSFISREEDHLLDPVPLQAVPPQIGELSSGNFALGGPSYELPSNNFEVGEPSYNFEVGGPSSVPNFNEGGEPSFSSMLCEVELPSLQGQSEAGEIPLATQTPYDDGILLAQLEEFLNTSPSHPQTVNNELNHLSILNEDVNQVPELNLDSIYNELGDLPVEPYPGPTEALAFSNTLSCDFELHPALAEFAEEHYVELSDFSFANEPHPYSNPTDSDGLIEAYLDSERTDNIGNGSQLRGPDVSGNDHLP